MRVPTPPESCMHVCRFLPSVIKGDLDSVRPEVLAFYTSHGVPIVDSSADQDTTDLTKCIAYVEEYLKVVG